MSLHSPCLKTFSSSLQSGWSVNLAWPSGLYNAELNVSNVMFYGFWTKCNFCFIQSLLVPWAYHVHSLFVSLLSPNWFYLSFPLFLKNPLSTFQGPVQVHSLRPLPSSIPWLSQSMELSPSSFFFFWPQGMWDFSSPTMDQTHGSNPWPLQWKYSLTHWTAREVPLPPLNFCSTHSLQHPYLALSIYYLAICPSIYLYICGYVIVLYIFILFYGLGI